MTAPRRLLEDNEVLARLVAADARHAPSAAALQSLLDELDPAPPPTPTGPRSPRRWPAIAGAAGVALIAVAAISLSRGAVAPPATIPVADLPASPPPAPSPVVVPPAASAVPSVAIADLPNVRLEPPVAPLAAPPSAAPRGSVRREIELIDAARRALSAGDPGATLGSVDAYDREYPAGQFAAEARVMRIEASAARGDRAAAERMARAFLAANPGSPYAARLRSLVSAMEVP